MLQLTTALAPWRAVVAKGQPGGPVAGGVGGFPGINRAPPRQRKISQPVRLFRAVSYTHLRAHETSAHL
eukprot:5628953-Alexandrium_andersonii.AAC.1